MSVCFGVLQNRRVISRQKQITQRLPKELVKIRHYKRSILTWEYLPTKNPLLSLHPLTMLRYSHIVCWKKGREWGFHDPIHNFHNYQQSKFPNHHQSSMTLLSNHINYPMIPFPHPFAIHSRSISRYSHSGGSASLGSGLRKAWPRSWIREIYEGNVWGCV